MEIFKLLDNEGELRALYTLATFLSGGKRTLAVWAIIYGNVGIMLNSTNSKDAIQSGTHIRKEIGHRMKW